MKKLDPHTDYVRSSPCFFRLIRQAMAVVCLLVVALAALLPAPLLEPANLATVPNPSRAAWFLVWTQEVVSYSKQAVYGLLLLGLLFAVLPWLPRTRPARQARWLPADQRWVNALTLLTFGMIVALTFVALYLRGENWVFGWFF